MLSQSQVKINGVWENFEGEEWLNEVVACTVNVKDLTLNSFVKRYQLITALRKSKRHKPINVKIC